jgi:hypothetical protein
MILSVLEIAISRNVHAPIASGQQISLAELICGYLAFQFCVLLTMLT